MFPLINYLYAILMQIPFVIWGIYIVGKEKWYCIILMQSTRCMTIAPHTCMWPAYISVSLHATTGSLSGRVHDRPLITSHPGMACCVLHMYPAFYCLAQMKIAVCIQCLEKYYCFLLCFKFLDMQCVMLHITYLFNNFHCLADKYYII